MGQQGPKPRLLRLKPEDSTLVQVRCLTIWQLQAVLLACTLQLLATKLVCLKVPTTV